MARRVDDIAENVLTELSDKNVQLAWFSLALDVSTDASNTAQVLIFYSGINENSEVYDEILNISSIHGSTTGENIFK